MKKTKCYGKDPNFVTRSVAGETLLVPIKSSTKTLNSLFVLNEVATETWKRLDGKKSSEEIQKDIVSLYDVDPKTVKDDFENFMASLQDIGAIQETAQ